MDKRYTVIKKLGSGAFGEIYKGKVTKVNFRQLTNTNFYILTLVLVEKRKTGEFLAAKVVSTYSKVCILKLCAFLTIWGIKEKAVPMQKHIMLFWESKLIHKLRGKTFVPFLHFVGDEKSEDGKAYHVMVMDLLGKSLEDLF